jgi:hypothetical protein
MESKRLYAMRYAITYIWSQKNIEDPDIKIAPRSTGPGFIRDFAVPGFPAL